MSDSGRKTSKASDAGALRLLVRVNLLQAWRRLLAIREQSFLLTSVILLFLAGYAWVAFMLFYKGLGFLRTFPGLGDLLIERLLFLLFAVLFILLLFSNLIISYTNLFRNRETHFLLTAPVTSQTIYQWKFIESTMLASWAFIFLIAPMLCGYGMVQGASWDFYVLTLLLVVMFIVLPAVFGSWCAITLARFMDRRLFQIIALVCAGIFILMIRTWLQPEKVDDDAIEARVLAVLDRVMAKTRFSQFPALPSYWLSATVQNWAAGMIPTAGFYFMVMLSHVLFFGTLAFTRMGNFFYDASSTIHSRAHLFGQWEWFRHLQERRREFHFRAGFLERVFSIFTWLQPEVRALIVKDVRMFWRDTTQWGQTLVLFGLLAVYIVNIRHFTRQLSNEFWIHLISFLNLFACSLNLATLTTRFVFPQFSLEGKRLWVVGMAPLGLIRVVKTKFAMSAFGSLVVTMGLIMLSCYFLRLPLDRSLFFTGTIAIMTLTLNAMAIGLGVLFPNFREDNPGKIVSGFGGTFCLVLSFLYIVSSIALLATGSPWSPSGRISVGTVLGCSISFIVLSLIVGWIPLRLALKKVVHFEH